MSSDLKKANEILVSISKQNKNITPITPQDYDLFNEFFAKEPHTYGNSWSYIIQGMYGIGKNNLGYKYFDGKNLSAISIHPKIEQPDQLAMYFVRPMGEGMMKVIAKLGKEYKKEFDLQIYAKKLFKDQYDELIELGFKDVKENPWHTLAPAEDDTYPERILDIKNTINIAKNLGKTRQLNRSYKHYLSYKENPDIEIKEIFDNKDEAKLVIDNFFTIQKFYKDTNISNPQDYYNYIEPLVNFSKNSVQIVVYTKTKPVGILYCDVYKNTGVLFVSLTLRNIMNNLTSYMMFTLFEKLLDKNIRELNLGGSEQKNLDDFKMKFRPISEVQMYWATIF